MNLQKIERALDYCLRGAILCFLVIFTSLGGYGIFYLIKNPDVFWVFVKRQATISSSPIELSHNMSTGILRQKGAGQSGTALNTPLDPKNPLTWVKASSREFGCMLEKEFQYVDTKFNCSLADYSNEYDPCKNPRKYYEGPLFPKAFAHKVHPKAVGIDLSWEQGVLYNTVVFFDKSTTDDEIRKSFHLPSNYFLGNCSLPCLHIQGYEHVEGACRDSPS
jgi:hypothetical protein